MRTERASWTTRATAVTAVALCVAVGLSGCSVELFFPSRPNAAPLFFTVRDGGLVFRWCGETTDVSDGLEISYRIETGDRDYVTAAEGRGAYRFIEGEEFSASSPPEGLRFHRSVPVPITADPTVFFVNTSSPDPESAGRMLSFTVSSPSQLREGEWVGTTGPVEDEPCSSATG